MFPKMTPVQAWQHGSGPNPDPSRYIVLCTGCSLCAKEGHVKRPTTEEGWDQLYASMGRKPIW
jgi:hypothetical protein